MAESINETPGPGPQLPPAALWISPRIAKICDCVTNTYKRSHIYHIPLPAGPPTLTYTPSYPCLGPLEAVR